MGSITILLFLLVVLAMPSRHVQICITMSDI
jgi:hypothetical protein